MNITKLMRHVIGSSATSKLKFNNYCYLKKAAPVLNLPTNARPMFLSTRIVYLASNMNGPRPGKDPKKDGKKFNWK